MPVDHTPPDLMQSLLKAAESSGDGLPPVDKWNPTHCDTMDMVIRRDGSWWHEGRRITRQRLVKLFARILRKDDDGVHYLVTPVEKQAVQVEAAPFVAVRVDRGEDGGSPVLFFTTNLGDVVAAGPDHPIRVEIDAETGAPEPFVLVRGRLEALINRPAFYELVEMAQIRDVDGQPTLFVTSNGETFDLGPNRMTPEAILDLLDRKLDHPERPANAAARGDGELDGRIIPSGTTLQQAAVLAPLILHDGPPRFLFTVRAAHLTKHAGQISFPGGRREIGETLAEAALRETREEIGITPEYVDIIGCFDPYETVTAFQVTPFVGVVKPGYTVTPDQQEVSDVFETPFDFLMNAANHERHEMEFRGQLRRFWAMPYEERYIWGATAGMLKALHDRLFGET